MERENQWLELYFHHEGIHHYAINSILFLTTIREKYMKMYERFIEELKMYSKAVRILSKRLLTNFSISTLKIRKNSE